MPFKTPVAYIDIRTSVHATEDQEKVLKALHNILPTENTENILFTKRSLTGHHGNPITLLETRIQDRSITHKTLEKISANLGIIDKELLNNEIDHHVEKGNLYIRLDKQSAYLGETKLSQADPIHLRIHFRKHSHDEVFEICRRFGLIP